MNGYLNYAKYLLYKENIPVSLVYFITSRCNLRCNHCFFLNELDSDSEELSLEEIETFSKSMGNFLSLSLTGGEPFLREDIAEIAQIFSNNNSIRNLTIPTNGLLKNKVLSGAEKILSNCPELALNLAVSLDGLSKIHDKVRNFDGCFDRALQTFKAAKDLKRKFPKLSLEIITTMSTYNQDHLDEFYDFIIDELAPDSINLSPVRGDVKDASMKNIDAHIYDKNIKRLQKLFLKQKITGYANFTFSEYAFALRMIMPKIVSKTLQSNAYQTACYAGKLSGVIYSNGDVYPCELLNQKMGNLRDFNFDFMELWQSKQAQDIRDHIKKSKCFCIHPCNFTVNILFNIRYSPQLAAYGLWLKYIRECKKIK